MLNWIMLVTADEESHLLNIVSYSEEQCTGAWKRFWDVQRLPTMQREAPASSEFQIRLASPLTKPIVLCLLFILQ